MVVDPHDPDDGEADDVRGQRRPLRAQLVGQVAVAARLSDRQDQQRDGDGEYPIAEGLDSSLVHRRGPVSSLLSRSGSGADLVAETRERRCDGRQHGQPFG